MGQTTSPSLPIIFLTDFLIFIWWKEYFNAEQPVHALNTSAPPQGSVQRLKTVLLSLLVCIHIKGQNSRKSMMKSDEI